LFSFDQFFIKKSSFFLPLYILYYKKYKKKMDTAYQITQKFIECKQVTNSQLKKPIFGITY
ncbi:hypothetical protein KYX90_13595, partial [Enterococcus lactis]|uniref:hypothetical protein n=1 Tax=Enterococcus lactis TaxID=357441 RepID=UPI001C7DF328